MVSQVRPALWSRLQYVEVQPHPAASFLPVSVNGNAVHTIDSPYTVTPVTWLNLGDLELNLNIIGLKIQFTVEFKL